MARPTKSEKFQLTAQARTCLRKSEYTALGRHARLQNTSISELMRKLILAEITTAASPATA